ncbi:hypothetical protein [Listeria sp. ILCC797]|uniref:hypothetical protein n=1 Tax=Listeria sp. ILCC797 TaxID=1918333 RepID=UPI000B58B5E7|nr:hypothetical protein [Listeria sp. ILCC797]
MIKCDDLVEIQDRTGVEEFCIDGETYKVIAKVDGTLTLQDISGFSKFNIPEMQVKVNKKALSGSDILHIMRQADTIHFYKHECTIDEAYNFSKKIGNPQFVKSGKIAWFDSNNDNVSITAFLKEGENNETA